MMEKPLHWAAASGEQGGGFFQRRGSLSTEDIIFEEGEILGENDEKCNML